MKAKPERMTLVEWAEAYVRHRDLFEKRMTRLEREGAGDTGVLTVTEQDGSTYKVFIAATLHDELLNELSSEKVFVVTRNEKANVLWVVQHWKRLVTFPLLKLVFANAVKNEKWLLVPTSHAKVSENGALKSGLLAMHDAIPKG